MRALLLSIVAGLAAGCATAGGAAFSAKPVLQGMPVSSADGRSPGADSSLKAHKKTVPDLPVKPVKKEIAAATAETTDPQLAAALRLLATKRSAGNQLRVAREYLRLGILDTAYSFADRALKQKPRLAEAHDVMARIWRDWGLPGLGVASASRATYFDPASAAAENTLGTLFNALGHPEQARLAFVRAVALDAGAGWALNNLCFVELQLDRLIEARSHCEAALRVDPTLVAAHNNLALTFIASGDAPGAWQAFLAGSDPAAAAYNRGIVHLSRREYAWAGQAFQEAIAARPAFSAAKARAHEARMLSLTDSHF